MFRPGMWPSGSRDPLDPEQLLREFERLLDAVTGSTGTNPLQSAGVFPALNVSRDAENYYVRAELPGVRPEDLDITTEGQQLILTGRRQIAAEPDVSYHRRERAAGSFSRTIALPGPFEGERVDAQYVAGVLTITLPIGAAHKPKRIAVSNK